MIYNNVNLSLITQSNHCNEQELAEASLTFPALCASTETDAPMAVESFRRRRVGSLVMGFALIGGVIGAHNVVQNEQYLGFAIGSSDLDAPIDGCPVPPEPEASRLVAYTSADGTVSFVSQSQANQAEEKAVAGEVSSAYKNDIAGVNPLATLDQLKHAFDHRISTVMLGETGVTVEIYSDQPGTLTIDEEAFTLLALSSLKHNNYTHSGLRHNFACLQDRILRDREFAGTVLCLTVSSDYRKAMINGRFQMVNGTEQVPENDLEWDEFWEQRKQQNPKVGFTPPAVYIGLPFDVWEWQHSCNYMALAPGVPNAERANRILTRKIGHEFTHFWLNLVGAPVNGNAAEQMLHLADKDTERELFEDGYPFAVVYKEQ